MSEHANLDDIIVTPLHTFELAEGNVMHGMRNSDPEYAGFGEAYFSVINEGAIKAWKCHLQMTLNLILVCGEVKFVFATMNNDGAAKANFREIILNRQCHSRLTVPPGIWFGFKGIGTKESTILNIANIIHDPDEVKRMEQSSLKYSW